VEEGATERTVRLPPGEWLDWWTDEQHSGPDTITVDAPLDRLPLFMRAGGVVPMRDPRLQTLVDAEDPDVVDPSAIPDRIVVRAIAGSDSVITLRDGTRITQRTYDRGLQITVEGTIARQYLVEAIVRADTVGPWDAAPIRSGVPGTFNYPELSDLEDCQAPCTHRGDGRLYVLVEGPVVSVAFGDDPDPANPFADAGN
jgi:hypothetical protein